MNRKQSRVFINLAIVALAACIALLVLIVMPETAFSHDTRMLEILGFGDELDEADLSLYRGNVLVKNGLYAQAIKEYTKTIDLNPYYTMAYINRSITYMDLGINEKALQDLNLAMGLEPDNYEIYINRGLVYAGMNHFDSAIADCNKAIELDSVAVEAYANRGNYYAQLGEMEKGLADCEQALSIDSSYASAWLGCTLINLELGRKEEAAKAFKVLLKYNPPHLSAIIEQLKNFVDTTAVK